MKKILYVSSVCSEDILQYIFETSKVKPQLAAQKFHRLLAEGLSKCPQECTIETLSSIPVIPANHSRRFWSLTKTTSNGLTYNYIPMLNINGFKNIGVLLYTFIKVFFWSLINRRSKVVICDILNVTLSMASLAACKLTGCKIITIVTDLPGMMVSESSGQVGLANIPKRLTWFDGYVILTDQMNSVVNSKSKPYLVMEGLVDVAMEGSKNTLENKYTDKIVMYAGGLYEKYGVKKLIDAFKLLEDPSYQLHLYGLGPMVDTMSEYIGADTRITYKGVVPNPVVVSEQLKVTLLVNPRPSAEEFTKYSFPSKNVEYMVSGTPMATTKLQGMPKEYHKYVYLFEEETTVGMYETFNRILSQNPPDLHSFGLEAKSFVLEKKNNVAQAKRILEFSNSLVSPIKSDHS
ncbi:glycosyltransferase [Muricauda sp. 2012CJ35-5]|uniref:Glycosyltransferase n=1 Tax=Flagellimonas spongiicola TaxID=2942208 RepID=A0ABT0PVZ6_9FLAO|nr:glycosyltransferase [Allomuricauda spongiicola]MCL6275544.1 glycosyltransferase [Allomuricauda spongiicola]